MDDNPAQPDPPAATAEPHHRDTALQWAREDAARCRVQLGDDQLRLVASFFHGHNERAPTRLHALFVRDEITADALTVVLAQVWRYQDHDCDLPVDAWRAMFLTTQFIHQVDGVGFCAARAPRRPRRLFRGSTETTRDGLGWTSDPEVARWFQHRHTACTPTEATAVWTAVVPPARMLARLDHEDEFVVDARGLDIVEYDPTRTAERLRRLARRGHR